MTLGTQGGQTDFTMGEMGALVYVNEGSFGRITAWDQEEFCFKSLISEDETGQKTLLKEFHM